MKNTLTITLEWWDDADPQRPIPPGWQEDLALEGFQRAQKDYTAGFTSGVLGFIYGSSNPGESRRYRGHWTVTETKED